MHICTQTHDTHPSLGRLHSTSTVVEIASKIQIFLNTMNPSANSTTSPQTLDLLTQSLSLAFDMPLPRSTCNYENFIDCVRMLWWPTALFKSMVNRSKLEIWEKKGKKKQSYTSIGRSNIDERVEKKHIYGR